MTPLLQALEERDLLSTILWVNRGSPTSDTDNFNAVFGAQAEMARSVVDSALASWQAVIRDLNFADGTDTFRLTLAMNPSDQTNGAETWSGLATDGQGRPESALTYVGVGRGGHGAGWFLDSNPLDVSAFAGGAPNPYVRDASPSNPAWGQGDFYSVVLHETMHALGFNTNPLLAFQQNVHGYLHATGVADAVDRPGSLFVFSGPGVAMLLTSDDGAATDQGTAGHVAAAGNGARDPISGAALSGSIDLMNPVYAWGRRTLISAADVQMLADAYGYSVATAPTFGAAMSRAVIAVGSDAPSAPEVVVYRGGAAVRAFEAYDLSFTGGVRVGVGDVNGDGIPDIVTAPGPGMEPLVRVWDGSTGQLLRQFDAYSPLWQSGVYVALGDVNADGYADIITGADSGGGPHVEVWSGKDGSLLRSFMAYSPLFGGGVRVAAGDVNGDGYADVLTAAGPGGGPHVEAWSGHDGTLLRSFYAYAPSFAGGASVAAGRILGDAPADIIIGLGPGAGPQVEIFRGTDGSLTRSFLAADSSVASGLRVAAADFTGDGTADIVTVPAAGASAAVTVYDNTGQIVLDEFYASVPAFNGGIFVGAGS